MIFRNFNLSDCDEIYKLFYDTVHTINAKDYTKEQIDVWAKKDFDTQGFCETFLVHYTIIAEENGMITGFGDVNDFGYLDRLYIHKDYQNRGIATTIVDKLEAYSIQNKVVSIYTHASITAKPFFEKRGYETINQQQVIRDKVYLTNFVMKKRLIKNI